MLRSCSPKFQPAKEYCAGKVQVIQLCSCMHGSCALESHSSGWRNDGCSQPPLQLQFAVALLQCSVTPGCHVVPFLTGAAGSKEELVSLLRKEKNGDNGEGKETPLIL